jgi:hypothetical protein
LDNNNWYIFKFIFLFLINKFNIYNIKILFILFNI